MHNNKNELKIKLLNEIINKVHIKPIRISVVLSTSYKRKEKEYLITTYKYDETTYRLCILQDRYLININKLTIADVLSIHRAIIPYQ